MRIFYMIELSLKINTVFNEITANIAFVHVAVYVSYCWE